MENKLILTVREKIKDKKVLILGFGKEGKGSLAVVSRAGGYSSLAIADLRELSSDEVKAYFCGETLPKLISGEAYLQSIKEYDIVFKSPGIVLCKEDYEKADITSQTEVFLEVYKEQVIGITGTKGKSTTTTLIYHILKESGMKTVLLGNIGIPAFDGIDEIEKDTKIVFELSCHQLENGRFSPGTAVYLNVFPEHLDHYKYFEAYQLAKENIYKYQKEGDRLYCGTGVIPREGEHRGKLTVVYDFNRGDEALPFAVNPENEGKQSFVKENNITHNKNTLILNEEEIALKGHHNLFDIAVAFAVCSDLGVDERNFLSALKTYRTLPHRLEYFGTFDGVKYYDDSISTIPETTIAALETIKDTDTVIIGGMDRGIDYSPLIDYLCISTVPNIILMEFTGARIYDEIKTGNMELYNSERLLWVDNLEEAVKKAKEVTKKGYSCIMSPAAASYGIFKDFEERGEVFKFLVKEEKG